MQEISPEELEQLRELGRKIKAGKQLEEVTMTIEDEEGIAPPQEVVITDPGILKAFQRAAVIAYEKYCAENSSDND